MHGQQNQVGIQISLKSDKLSNGINLKVPNLVLGGARSYCFVNSFFKHV